MDITLTVHLPELAELAQAVRTLNHTLEEGFLLMSEASDALNNSVVQLRIAAENLGIAIQEELPKIRAALATTGGGDPDVGQAALDAVIRLDVVTRDLQPLTETIRGIVS